MIRTEGIQHLSEALQHNTVKFHPHPQIALSK